MELNNSEKATKLHKIASDFALGGLPKTAQVLHSISATFGDTRNLRKKGRLEPFLGTYELEYKEIFRERPFNKECFDVVGKILVEALRPDRRDVRADRSIIVNSRNNKTASHSFNTFKLRQ